MSAGKWEGKKGGYVQSTTGTFLSSFVKEKEWDLSWIRYTLELKSMKLGGNEG